MSLAAMETILQEFGASIGIPDLKPDEEYRCNMQFDDVAVSFELGVDEDRMFIYALLGNAAEADTEAVYVSLLQANYIFEGTAGSTLSIDPRSGGIVLMRAERLNALRLATFEALVEDFVNVAEQWMKRIQSGDFEARAARSPAESLPSGGGMMRV